MSVGMSLLSIKVTVPSAGKRAFLAHFECSDKSASSEIGGAVSFGVISMGDILFAGFTVLEGRGLKRGGRGGGSSGIDSFSSRIDSSTDSVIGWKAFANTNGCGEE